MNFDISVGFWLLPYLTHIHFRNQSLRLVQRSLLKTNLKDEHAINSNRGRVSYQRPLVHAVFSSKSFELGLSLRYKELLSHHFDHIDRHKGSIHNENLSGRNP